MKIKNNKNNNGENRTSILTIGGILGEGVTCIGSRNPSYRYILQEQMAFAIATGKPFLDHFETIQNSVLIFRNGKADYSQTEKRLDLKNINEDLSENLIIKENKYHFRIKPSIEPEAQDSLETYHEDIFSYLKTVIKVLDISVFIIPDLNDIRMSCKSYLENEFEGCKSTYTEESLRSPKLQNIDYHRDIDSVKHLRDFAARENILIITGHDIGSRGGFSYSHGPLYADNKIYLLENKKGWELIIRGSAYVPTSNFKLEYKDFIGFRIAKKEKERMTNLSLLDSEKKIITLLIKKGPMRFTDITKNTSLPSSTLAQKLKALQTEKKGCWIVHSNGTYEAVRRDCFWFDG